MTSKLKEPHYQHVNELSVAELVAGLHWCARWSRRQKMKQIIRRAAEFVERQAKPK